MQATLSKINSRNYVKSSSFAMALLFTFLCGLAALSLGYFINYFAKGHFIQSTESILETEIRHLMPPDSNDMAPKVQNNLIIIPAASITRLADIIGNGLITLAEGLIVFDYDENGRRYAARILSLEDGRKILVGTDITEVSRDFRFMQWLGIASIIFITLVVFVSFLISIFVVKGTNKIAATARDIMDTGDLSQRISIGSHWDDLGNMAAILNVFLSRIEDLMQGVKQVSDNIAHDLRTPLTRLRHKLETIQDETVQKELLSEADHLLNTFNALLRISRIETEKQRSRFRKLNVQELLCDVVEYYEPLAEDKGITIQYDCEECFVIGDRDLLFQAFANLMDNALKFSPQDGVIILICKKSSKNIKIILSDSGQGIPQDDLARIFERFYRAEASRTTNGTGLGLSLVKAVIELHAGQVYAENAPQGSRFITIL